MNGKYDITIKWLGLAGVELHCHGETLLIDPVFSHMPLQRVLLGRLAPDEETVRSHAPRCGHIFITHAHYDHLLDAPHLSKLTGAVLHGPANACAIAGVCGVDRDKLYTLKPGDKVFTAAFTITALRSSHLRLPGFGYGKLPGYLVPPLRAQQYRMDESFVYLIEAAGYRLLVGPGICQDSPGKVDALLCCPLYMGRKFTGYVGALQPRVFLPIHWEDMFRPTDEKLRPGIIPGFPPRRVDMETVAWQTGALGVRYFEPERNHVYLLSDLLE